MRFSIFLILFFFTLHSLKGQTAIPEELDSIVIISSRIHQHQRETGRDITVLSRRELASIPASSLEELLRYFPGIETQQRGLFGVQGDLSLRGSTFAQVLVLLDGMRINDPLTGHFNNNFPVTLAEIERIEIIRGPSSAAYGPDAVGGIINIITSTFSPRKEITGLHSSGSVMAGENKLRLVEAGLQTTIGKLLIGGGLSWRKSEGYPFEDGQAGRFDLRTGTLSARLGLSEKLVLAYRLSTDQRDFSAWHFYTMSKADTAEETTRSIWHQLKTTYTTKKGVTNLDIGFKTGHDNYLFNPVSLPNTHSTRLLNLHLSQQINLRSNLSFIAGAQALQQNIESTDRGMHELSSGGMYLLGFWRIAEMISVNLGGRIEYNEVYGAGFLPQAAISWKLDQLTFRIASGKSFRAPDFTERFIGTALSTLAPNRSIGNPDLSAEKSWTHEAGADWQAGTPFRFGITIFNRNGRDLIDYVRTRSSEIRYNAHLLPDTTYFYAQNFSTLSTTGVETYVGSNIIAGQWNLALNMGYTYLHSRTDEEIISRYLSNHSKNLVSGSMEASFKWIRIGIAFIWKEREMNQSMKDLGMDPHFFSINGQSMLLLLNQKLSLDLKINNLTGRKNMDIPGLQLPGRWISAGIGWKF